MMKSVSIVLTGSGEKAFVAGADINEMAGIDIVGVNKMNKVSRMFLQKLKILINQSLQP